MSMNEKAIQEIIKNANTKQVMDGVGAIDTQSNIIAIPDNFILKDLENHMPNRDRFRAHMSTQHIEEFARYNEQYSDKEGSQCFINADSMSATSYFDLGTKEKALHCDHKATLELKRTALFTELLSFNGQQNSQRDAAEWIEDHAEFIISYDSEGNSIPVANVSAAIRNLTVNKDSGRTTTNEDFAATQSEFENVAIKTKEGLTMPATLKIMCTPYNGLGLRSFELRHSITFRNKDPIITFRIKLLEKQQEDMADEFKEILDKRLEEVIPTYIGTLSVQLKSATKPDPNVGLICQNKDN